MLWALVLVVAMAAGGEGQDGGWSPWSVWSRCTATCGGGLQVHGRACDNPTPGTHPNDKFCVGESQEDRVCNEHNCPTAGGWSHWSGWTRCTASCGVGVKIRVRSCTNPIPMHGGAHCVDDSHQTTQCNTQHCPRGNVLTRNISNTNPTSAHGGAHRGGAHRVDDSHQTTQCNTQHCPRVINGIWSDWVAWTGCSVSCGGGAQLRWRYCDNPGPNTYGKYCEGRGQALKACNTGKCPIPGAGFVGFCMKLLPTVPYSLYPPPTNHLHFDKVLYNDGGYYQFRDHAFHTPVTGVYLFTLTANNMGPNNIRISLRIKYKGKITINGSIYSADTNKRNGRNAATTLLLKMYKDAIMYLVSEGGALQAGFSTFCGMLVQRLEE